MSTKHRELFQSLAQPFHPTEVKTRAGGGGRQLSYITARVAQNRFDEVVGPENWRNRYRLEQMSGGVNFVVCTIEIKIDGEWIPKEDAGGFKEMTEKGRDGKIVEDEENTPKTAYSDSFKRAATAWGVGRYLYNDGGPIYPEVGTGAGFAPHDPPPAVSEPEPIKPHAPGKSNQHPNRSGFHNGQYASIEDTKKYLDRLKEKVDALNSQWADFWINPVTGEVPNVSACEKDLMSVFQADGHIVKWLVETGQIDADAMEKNGKPAVLGRHAAIILGRSKADAAAMKAELDSYMARTFEAKKEVIYKKHPELAPDGFAEEQAELAAADDKGDAYEEALAN